MCVFNFSTTFVRFLSATFIVLGNNPRAANINVLMSSREVPLFLSYFN
jgi:hypothetical protein